MYKSEIPDQFRQPRGWLWGAFTNARGKSLRFGALAPHEKPLAHVVYIEGLSEFAEKTFELARDFNAMSCNFSVFDRFGQGKSGRYLANPHKQHSDGIDKDVDDIIRHCRENVPSGQPIVLAGHSTGGLLALLALQRAPDLFAAAILTAPLLGLKIEGMKKPETLFSMLPLPGFIREAYVPGGGNFRKRDDAASKLKAADFSGDPDRMKLNDLWMTADPALQTGAPTVGWVQEMARGILNAIDPAFLKSIRRPVLVFSAGQDKVVENAPILDAVRHLPAATHVHLAGGKHEIWIESDEIRAKALGESHDFIRKIVGNP